MIATHFDGVSWKFSSSLNTLKQFLSGNVRQNLEDEIRIIDNTDYFKTQ